MLNSVLVSGSFAELSPAQIKEGLGGGLGVEAEVLEYTVLCTIQQHTSNVGG